MKKNKNEFEVCVSCKKKLDIKKDMPIEMRQYYVAGVGQLCKKCYVKLYLENINDN